MSDWREHTIPAASKGWEGEGGVGGDGPGVRWFSALGGESCSRSCHRYPSPSWSFLSPGHSCLLCCLGSAFLGHLLRIKLTFLTFLSLDFAFQKNTHVHVYTILYIHSGFSLALLHPEPPGPYPTLHIYTVKSSLKIRVSSLLPHPY